MCADTSQVTWLILKLITCYTYQIWIFEYFQTLTGNDPLMTFDPLTEHTPDALTKEYSSNMTKTCYHHMLFVGGVDYFYDFLNIFTWWAFISIVLDFWPEMTP